MVQSIDEIVVERIEAGSVNLKLGLPKRLWVHMGSALNRLLNRRATEIADAEHEIRLVVAAGHAAAELDRLRDEGIIDLKTYRQLRQRLSSVKLLDLQNLTAEADGHPMGSSSSQSLSGPFTPRALPAPKYDDDREGSAAEDPADFDGPAYRGSREHSRGKNGKKSSRSAKK
jgi:hypothetical protein